MQHHYTAILTLSKSPSTTLSLIPKNSSISHLTSTYLPANHSCLVLVRYTNVSLASSALSRSTTPKPSAPSQPPIPLEALTAVLHRLRHPLRQLRHHSPWVQRVRQDPLLAILDVRELRQPQQRKLRRLVGAPTIARDVRAGGRDIQHRLSLAGQQEREEGPRHEVRPPDILPRPHQHPRPQKRNPSKTTEKPERHALTTSHVLHHPSGSLSPMALNSSR